MDMGINPEIYKSTKELSTIDFLDLATCKAQELDLEKEFEDFQNKNGYMGE